MDSQKYIREYSFSIVTNSGLGFECKPIGKKFLMHINNIQKY